MKFLTTNLLVFTIFLDSIYLIRGPFDFYLYYLFFFAFLIFCICSQEKIKYNLYLLLSMSAVVVIGLINNLIIGFPIYPILKQYILILFSSITYYLIIRLNNFNINKLFKIYANLSVYICAAGLLKSSLYFWGVNLTHAYRINSIMSEPAHFCIVITPVFFVALYNIISSNNYLLSKGKSLLIVLTYSLSFSGVGLIGIILSMLFIIRIYGFFKFSKKNLIVASIIIISVSIISPFIYKVPDFKLRIDDSWNILTQKSNIKAESLNLSTFALYSNFLVAKESFLQNPFIGSGIGTHALNYDLYIDKVLPEESHNKSLKLNRPDAASLFNRLLSETGSLGLIIFLYFIFKYKINFSKTSQENVTIALINYGIFISFILRLLRFGNYSALGFFFFAFLYYFSYKKSVDLIPDNI